MADPPFFGGAAISGVTPSISFPRNATIASAIGQACFNNELVSCNTLQSLAFAARVTSVSAGRLWTAFATVRSRASDSGRICKSRRWLCPSSI